MQKLSSLPGWPPEGGAGPFDTRKAAFALSPELVKFRRVDRVVGKRIDMTCMFAEQVVTFRFFASDVGMAENVAEVLKKSEGKSLFDLGLLTVEESE